MKKTIIIALMLSFLCVLLTSCGNDKSRMLGRWDAVGQYSEAEFLGGFELCEDGTIICDGLSGTYTINDGKFTFSVLWAGGSYDYKLEGSTLTLTKGSKTATYQKQ